MGVTNESVQCTFPRISIKLFLATKDWYDTFVAEGFATYFQSVILNHYHGYGKIYQFLDGEAALRYDEAVKSTIIPNDINYNGFDPFSPIVYNKPSSVFHTLQKVVGEDVFMEGLKAYILDKAFKNVDDTTLWAYFTQVPPFVNVKHLNI